MATLFLFHRDLRLYDNVGLNAALAHAKAVVPVFIFTPTQISPQKNKYFSSAAVQFMIESLTDLNHQLQNNLNIFYGEPTTVLAQIHRTTPIAHIYTNQDYTPYATKRDAALADWCAKQKISWNSYEDYPLLPIETALLKPGQPYQKFTPFYNKAKLFDVARPKGKKTASPHQFIKLKSPHLYDPIHIQKKLTGLPPHPAFRGGRTNALARLQHIRNLKDYNIQRNIPSVDGTSRMSAYIKFGCVSVREVYWFVVDTISPNRENALISELFWRDFYLRITYFFPQVLANPNRALRPKYEAIPWSKNTEHFKSWATGHTGVPFVDAGMRQLNATGWMHNRTRMVTAMFLSKNLLIDWREGERYFATKLIDYDPSSNNGGWQWSASTGIDSQPYFRIFNPYLQSQRFDPEAKYIKQWVPELAKFTPKQITSPPGDDNPLPPPIIDVKAAAQHAIKVYALQSRVV